MKDRFLRAARVWIPVLLLLCLLAPAGAEVYLDAEKPADWDQRDLLRIIFPEEVNDEAILVLCGGKTMMVDAGTGPYWPRYMPFLESLGITHVEIMYNSHPHYDHLEGEMRLIEHGLTADVFLSPFPEGYRNVLQKKVVPVLKKYGIPYQQLMPDEPFSLGNAEIVMYRYPDGKDPNALSGVLHITFGAAKILIPADLTGDGEKYLVSAYGEEGLKSDILKVPHHGIIHMTKDFLPTVQPKLAIFTNATRATQKANAQLEKYGIPYLHTSAGTIFLETDGTDWYVTQEPSLL